MKKIIFILTSIFLLCSCKSYLKEYEVLNTAVNEGYNKERGCDTIDIVKKTIPFNNYFFETYTQEKLDDRKGFFSTAHIFHWIDRNNKWVMSDEDIKYMQSIKSDSVTLNGKKIKNDKIKFILIDRPFSGSRRFSEIDPQEFKEISKRILNCRPLYEFSMPSFNKNGTIAIIARNQVLVGDMNYLIYKLVDNKWKLVGYTEVSSE